MARSKRPNSYQTALVTTTAGAPAKIKCSRCCIVKSPGSYSNKRLLDLKVELNRSPKRNAAIDGLVPCSSCTGSQRLDHTCSDCGKTKSTETGFTKTQLKKGDDALCIKCSNALNAMGPGGKDGSHDLGKVSEDSSEDSDADSDNSNPNGGSVLASGVTGRSSTSGGTFPSAWGMTTTTTSSTMIKSSRGGGVPLGPTVAATSSGPSSSSISTLATSMKKSTIGKATGLPANFNINAYGRPGSSVTGSTQSRNPGFAKIRKSTVPTSKKQGKQQASSEEDEDDEIIDSGSDWEEKNDLLHGI